MKCVKVHLCDPERADRGVHPGVQRAGQQDGEELRLQADELLHRQHHAQLRQGEIIPSDQMSSLNSDSDYLRQKARRYKSYKYEFRLAKRPDYEHHFCALLSIFIT